MKRILYILLFVGCFASAQNISPYATCQDGNPIGGGAGYSAILTSVGADIHITTNLSAASFKSTVEGATINDVIFIDSGVVIDLTALGNDSVDVPQGVTIASDRGTNTGALIKTDDVKYNGSGYERPVFKVIGTGVRFTGFRFQGPFGEVGLYDPTGVLTRKKWGISSHYNNTVIDNMELYNWPSGAVVLSRYATVGFYGPNQFSDGHLYHHNYVHNNKQNSWGYGIDTQFAESDVYANLFEENRHDITGRGDDLTGITAYCNTVMPGGTHHNFDMHRDPSSSSTDGVSGKYFYIHHNDFGDDGSTRSGINNEENIRITGIPVDSCTVQYNKFTTGKTSFHLDLVGDVGTWNASELSGVGQAFQQRQVSVLPTNVVWGNNTYNGDDPEGSVSVTGVEVFPDTDKMLVAGTRQLTQVVAPSTATDKTGTWATTNGSVATVVSGLVTAQGTGTCNITFTTTDGSFVDTTVITVEGASTEDSIMIVEPQGYYTSTSGDADSWDDTSGFGLHGAENGTITFTDEASFDGLSWYSIADPNGFQNFIPQTDAFTLIWREGDTAPTTGYSWSLIEIGAFQIGGAYSVVVDNFNGLYLGGSVETINPIINNNRLFIAIVETNQYNLWVDGVQVVTNSVSIGTDVVTSANPNIGGRSDGSYLVDNGATFDLVALVPKAISTAEKEAIETEFIINTDITSNPTRPSSANGNPYFRHNGDKKYLKGN